MEFSRPSLERIEEVLQIKGVDSSQYSIESLKGDLSPRKYFRLTEKSDVFKKIYGSSSVMAMVFDSVKPPEAEAKLAKTSDVAFIESTTFFSSNNLPVPRIYNTDLNLGVLITEDLGKTLLIDIASDKDKAKPYYQEAVSLIHKIQEIKEDQNCFMYTRGFDSKVLKREMLQFQEYILGSTLVDSEMQIVDNLFTYLSEELAKTKQVLVHRDFHSWNLMIDKNGQLRLIDFQDALKGTRSYDLVALLHERDIDLILDSSLIDSLEDQFFEYYHDEYLRDIEYPMTQLQRDLKVSGLFIRVKVTRGLDAYANWVPGTLKRIDKTLRKLFSKNRVFSEFHALLIDKGIV